MNLFENLQKLQEVNDKELLFSFVWEKGSLNDNIIKYLKSKNIRFRYGPYLQLFAQINGEWVRFYHENKDGKTNVYIIHSNSIIEKLTKESEKESEQIETKVNDPKFNFDDLDRNEEYIVESILNFEDWLDIHFDDLVKKYADKYEMSEEDVYSEGEDFEEYVNEKYEEYYRNTNRYLDDENEELLESINNNKYKITFNFDINEATSEAGSADEILVKYIDDECFKEAFDTIEKIKEFENNYNVDGNNISIKEIKYDSDNKKVGTIEVTLDSELQDEQSFAEYLVEYLFEHDWPELSYHASGTYYSDAWDGYDYYNKGEYIEDDYVGTISSYSDVTIKKIS